MGAVNEGGLRFTRSEALSTDAFFAVENLHYEDADGNPVVRSVVRHPGAVVVVPLLGESVVMIRQYRAAIDRMLLELPAGKLDVAGEALSAAASRECAEEIGYEPTVLTHLTSFWNSPGFTDEYTTVFLAEDLCHVGRRPHGAEEIASEVVEVPVADIGRLVGSGEIEDGKSLIGLMAYLQRHDGTAGAAQPPD